MLLSEIKAGVFALLQVESTQELRVKYPNLVEGLNLRRKADWEKLVEGAVDVLMQRKESEEVEMDDDELACDIELDYTEEYWYDEPLVESTPEEQEKEDKEFEEFMTVLENKRKELEMDDDEVACGIELDYTEEYSHDELELINRQWAEQLQKSRDLIEEGNRVMAAYPSL